MLRGLTAAALTGLLACAGCAVRGGAPLADAPPAAVPRSAPQKPPSPPAATDRPIAGAGSESSPAAPAQAAPTPAPTAAAPAATSPPAATASAYVFAPTQAVSSRPSPSPSGSAAPPTSQAAPVPEAGASAPREAAPTPRQDASSGTTRGELQLVVVASAPEIAAGAITTVDVMASSSTRVVDAPFHLSFDPNVVAFVDGAPGDFLTQGGSSIVFFVDGLSRPGDVAVAAGRVERERGASGAGLLCRVRFRGVGAGTTPVLVGRAKAWGTHGEELTVIPGGTTVVVH